MTQGAGCLCENSPSYLSPIFFLFLINISLFFFYFSNESFDISTRVFHCNHQRCLQIANWQAAVSLSLQGLLERAPVLVSQCGHDHGSSPGRPSSEYVNQSNAGSVIHQ